MTNREKFNEEYRTMYQDYFTTFYTDNKYIDLSPRQQKSLEIEYLFHAEMDFYKNWQEGTASEINFMWQTKAVFTERKTRPRRKPDYVSYDRRSMKVSSEYWYTEKGVIRGSNHWGNGTASCDWAFQEKDGKIFYGFESKPRKTTKTYGFCAWEDFVHKADFLDIDGEEVMTSFKNTVGKGRIEHKGKTHII